MNAETLTARADSAHAAHADALALADVGRRIIELLNLNTLLTAILPLVEGDPLQPEILDLKDRCAALLLEAVREWELLTGAPTTTH